jgi:fatty acid-binding protein DegV
MLKIKPLLTVEDGIVVPIEKIRGSKKLIRRMVELVRNDAGEDKVVKGGFVWGESDEQMSKLREQLNDSVQFEDLCSNNIGTVITSHAGPTTFGVGYFCEDR